MTTKRAYYVNLPNKIDLELSIYGFYELRGTCGNMANLLFSIIWLLILIFIGFWVACFAAGFYIFILPFTVCISALSGLTDFLLSVIQFPRYCATCMVEGRGFN